MEVATATLTIRRTVNYGSGKQLTPKRRATEKREKKH